MAFITFVHLKNACEFSKMEKSQKNTKHKWKKYP